MGKNPFKAKNYRESMKKNFNCYLDFEVLDDKISPDTIVFLKKLVSRDPRARLTSEMALEEESILASSMDENSNMRNLLRTKLRKAPSL